MTINKIINPCKCKVYTITGNKVSKNAFAKIKYDGKYFWCNCFISKW